VLPTLHLVKITTARDGLQVLPFLPTKVIAGTGLFRYLHKDIGVNGGIKSVYVWGMENTLNSIVFKKPFIFRQSQGLLAEFF